MAPGSARKTATQLDVGGIAVERYGLTDDVAAKMARFVGLVQGDEYLPPKWRKTAPAICADSMAALSSARVRSARRLADVGTGAGFPGMVLAIALPRAHMTLVEQSPMPCAFLRRAISELDMPNADVVEAQVARFPVERHGSYEMVVSRSALRPSDIFEWATPLLTPTGAILLWQRLHPDRGEELIRASADEHGLELAEVTELAKAKGHGRQIHVYARTADAAPGLRGGLPRGE
jgi:16S rRNA (guanine527-N7)-methyltransferase